MGNKIDAKYIQNKLVYADHLQGNKDGFVRANEKEAIALFENTIKYDYDNKSINEATYKQAMGLFTTKTVEKTTRAEKQETRADKKEQKEIYKTNNENRKAALAELTKVVSQGATLENIEETLAKHLTNPDYQEALAEVGILIHQIHMIGFNSKNDVENLKKAVKDEMYLDGIGKEILNKLVELAEQEQVQKETEEVLKLYENIKNTYYKEHKVHNFTFYQNTLEYGLEQEGKKGTSYYDKALNIVKTMIKQDSDAVNDSNRVHTTGEKAKTVSKELNEYVAKDDKISRQNIKKDNADNELDARYNKFHNNAEELKTISEDDLKKALGKDLFTEMNKAYLHTVKNEDGSYDLTALVEIFQTRMGYNYKINRSTDTEMAEYEHIKDDIRMLTGQYDLSKKDFKKLRDLCAVEMEKKDHSLAGALGVNNLKDALIGATASFLTSEKIIMTQEMRITLSTTDAEKILKQAEQLGYDIKSTQLANGNISIKLGQQMIKDTRLLQAFAGAGIGALQGVLLSMIIGQEKDEKSCFSVDDFDTLDPTYTEFDKFEEYITSKYPGGKGKALATLARTFVDDNGHFDRSAFDSMVNNIAGVGSKITCDEMDSKRIIDAKQVKTTTPPPAKEEETHTVSIKDIEATDPEYANVPVIDGTKTTWSKVVEMYGDCLTGIEVDKTKYPNCAKQYGKLAIRLVKVAQAITDGNYSYERLMDLAEKSFAAKTNEYTELENYPGINYNVLVNTMNATELGKDVRVPNSLAGCDKTTNTVKENIVEQQATTVVKAGDRGNSNYKVSDGTNAEFLIKVDNGEVERFSTYEERNAKYNKLMLDENYQDTNW